jgi:hypothetical protein
MVIGGAALEAKVDGMARRERRKQLRNILARWFHDATDSSE